MARIVLPGLANGLKCPHASTRIAALQTSDVGLRCVEVSPQSAASRWELHFSSQFTWPIILSRRSHNARTNASACAASRSPIEGVSQPVPGGASQAPVSGFQVRLQARGCAAQTGGSVRKPPYTGPDGVCIW